MSEVAIRSWAEDDRAFLWSMLYEAAWWRPSSDRPPFDEGMRAPDVRRYLEGWQREGDRALIATAGGEPIGAAWYRLFSADERGYGFVDATVPEVSLAVVARYRRQGVGRMLLAALLVQAHLDEHLAVSLSVDNDNPARSLYEELGFKTVEEEDNTSTMINRFAMR